MVLDKLYADIADIENVIDSTVMSSFMFKF